MEPKRGLFAGGGTTVRLPRQIPWPLAMEFLLCADLIPAERAYEMGLLNAVVPKDQLLDKAYEFARRITANAPLAVQATKQSALLGLYHDEHEIKALRNAVKTAAETLEQLAKELRTAFEKESRISSKIFQTEDAKEGPLAFAEKRKPNWQAK
jgi:enoyl-CoA hydratase